MYNAKMLKKIREGYNDMIKDLLDLLKDKEKMFKDETFREIPDILDAQNYSDLNLIFKEAYNLFVDLGLVDKAGRYKRLSEACSAALVVAMLNKNPEWLDAKDLQTKVQEQ